MSVVGEKGTRKAFKFKEKRIAKNREKELVEFYMSKHGMTAIAARECAHRAVGHMPSMPSCIVCQLAKQRRLEHSHKSDDSRLVGDVWHLDNFGRVTPESETGSRYGCAGRVEGGPNHGELLFEPLQISHSCNVNRALIKFHQNGTPFPKTVKTGEDTPFLGKCKETYDANGISHVTAPRYSSWRNGTAEQAVGACEDLGCAAIVDGNCNETLWDKATLHAVYVENWRKGIPGYDFPARLIGPFGCIVTCVREGPERERGEKFSGRAWRGFHGGFVRGTSDCIWVGEELENGNTKYFKSQNVRVFPNLRYWSSAPHGARERNRRTNFDVVHWCKVSCCGKWRELEEQLEREELDVTCNQIGYDCADAEDAGAYENVLELTHQEVFDEVHLIENHKKSDANSTKEWYGSGRTFKDVFTESRAKETGSFQKHGSIDFASVVKQSVWRKKNPHGTIALTNMLDGTKHIEVLEADLSNFDDLKAKSRLVVFGEIWAKDMTRVDTKLERKKEGLSTDAPTSTSMRAFDAIMFGTHKIIADRDFSEAYQIAESRDPRPCGVRLVPSAWLPEWHDMFTKEDPPICNVVGSLYGRNRAGDDFHSYAQESFAEIAGFQHLYDIDPCVSLRSPSDHLFLDDINMFRSGCDLPPIVLPEVKPSRVLDGSVRYSDDSRIAASSVEHAEFYGELLKCRFLSKDVEDSNGSKFVGTRTHVVNVSSDGDVTTLLWEQLELAEKYVEWFEIAAKERGIKYKKRSTPAPATDTPHMETREKSEARARVSAKQPESVGKFAHDRLSFVNRLAYLKDHTRHELSHAIWTLQCVVEGGWTAHHDKLLSWLYGFVASTVKTGVKGVVSRSELESGNVWVLAQSDASHACCRDTRKGTLGYVIKLKGLITDVTLCSATRNIPVVTLSSMESELAGAAECTKVAINVQMLVNVLLGYVQPGDVNVNLEGVGVQMGLEMDALSAINAIIKAGSSKVRHVRRTVGVSLYFLHERWVQSGDAWLRHRNGSELAADLFTKSLSEGPFLRHSADIGMSAM